MSGTGYGALYNRKGLYGSLRRSHKSSKHLQWELFYINFPPDVYVLAFETTKKHGYGGTQKRLAISAFQKYGTSYFLGPLRETHNQLNDMQRVERPWPRQIHNREVPRLDDHLLKEVIKKGKVFTEKK